MKARHQGGSFQVNSSSISLRTATKVCVSSAIGSYLVMLGIERQWQYPCRFGDMYVLNVSFASHNHEVKMGKGWLVNGAGQLETVVLSARTRSQLHTLNQMSFVAS